MLANRQFDYSGLDSLNGCLDRELFTQWPYSFDYKYNSRGFRDQEWPQDLESAVWCLGDSFTVGLGSCLAHTWPQQLSQHSQRRTINVAMDGASNEWIARTACDVYDLARPRNMVVMWSYLHRREHPNADLPDLDRRTHHVKSTDIQDFENFNLCREKIRTHCADSNLIELIIPNFSNNSFTDVAWKKIRDPSWPILLPSSLTQCQDLYPEIVTELRTLHKIDITGLLEFQAIQQQHPEFLSDLIRVEYLDRARDGFHFDLLTAEWVAAQVQNLLNL
jgi:hypothetical protein